MSNAIVPYSDSNQQPSVFNWNGHRITVRVDRYGEAWFDGPEVCKAAGINNPSMAYTRLDDDEKQPLSQIEGTPQLNGLDRMYVSESGMYNLILRSDKPEARAFKKFVTSEVLPTIRKTGSFSLQTVSSDELIVMLAKQNVETRKQLEALDRKQAEQAMQIEAVNKRVTKSEYFTIRQWCNAQRLNVSDSVKQKWGRDASYLSRAREVEIIRVNEGNQNVGSYHKSILMDVCIAKPKSDPDQPSLFVVK